MAEDENTNLQAMLEDQHPTLDNDYWSELNRKLRSYEQRLDSIIYSFPITVQGDMDTVIICGRMHKDNAVKLLKFMNKQVDSAKPFGCEYFLYFCTTLAIISFFFIFGLIFI